MAACGGLEYILGKPLSQSPTFLELHLKKDNVHHHDAIELDSFSTFTPSSPSSSSSISSPDLNPPIDKNDKHGGSTLCMEKYYGSSKGQQGRRASFSSMSSESLSVCTEGLGFESSDDMEEDVISNGREERMTRKSQVGNKFSKRTYPPPISCIGTNGKPLVYFLSYREDDRFILKEIRIPNQEMLHSYRENGRLRLQFILSDDEILKEEDMGDKNGDGRETDNNGEEGEREGEV